MSRHSCIRVWFAAVSLALGLGGCATSSVPDLNNHAVYKKDPVVFETSISQVKKAIIEAATALGCRKLAGTDTYYKGQLPHGEVIEFLLKPNGSGKTSAWVQTRRTYGGGAWQRDREAEVIQELKRAVMLVSRRVP